MAEIVINPDIAKLDKDPSLATRKTVFNTLLDGMKKANEGTLPDYSQGDYVTPLVDEDGNQIYWTDPDGNQIALSAPNQSVIEKKIAEISDIQMQNAAYLFASVITTAANSATPDIDLTAYLKKAGGSMTGLLGALHGFEAGIDGRVIFNVIQNAANAFVAHVYGNLIVDNDLDVKGQINLGDNGIWFSKHQAIFYNNSILKIENQDIAFKGDITIDGAFKLGDALINGSGIFWQGKEFYHSGNSNLSTIDWTMNNGNVHSNLIVKGDASIGGKLKSSGGFSLGALQEPLLYSETNTSIGNDGDTVSVAQVVLESDFRIINGHGIKFDNDYIINVRSSNVVSFSAPGMIMNLGDNSNGKQTSKISLQSDIWDYSNNFKLISKEGAGYFPNGLKADCAVNGSSVLETYRTDTDNLGVLFPKQIRFGTTSGAAIYQDPTTGDLNIQIPYKNGQATGTPIEQLKLSTYFEQTDSPFRDKSLEWSASLHFFTDGEFFTFDKPVEAEYFAIKSSQYKTRLIEDALFFDDGKFIEGVADGLRYTGNGYFDGAISSPSFASGFVGYGWAVKDEVTSGGFHATFDTLTVRKKMRVYELEVQNNSCTNGSLWVSDFCSGDEVIALD